MGIRRVTLVLITGWWVLIAAAAPLPAPKGEEAAWKVLLERYLSNVERDRSLLRDVTMEVEIEAELPRLKKEGRMRAIRTISKLGEVTYRAVSFIGDNTIKKDVIARFIKAEVDASGEDKRRSISINRENYKFRYAGNYELPGWKLHLFELIPRHRRVGLFRGWVWVEESSALPVREGGRLVKTPSVFLRRVDFVRDYDIRSGVAVPLQLATTIHTRVVGVANITMQFERVEFNGRRPSLALVGQRSDVGKLAGQLSQ